MCSIDAIALARIIIEMEMEQLLALMHVKLL